MGQIGSEVQELFEVGAGEQLDSEHNGIPGISHHDPVPVTHTGDAPVITSSPACTVRDEVHLTEELLETASMIRLLENKMVLPEFKAQSALHEPGRF